MLPILVLVFILPDVKKRRQRIRRRECEKERKSSCCRLSRCLKFIRLFALFQLVYSTELCQCLCFISHDWAHAIPLFSLFFLYILCFPPFSLHFISLYNTFFLFSFVLCPRYRFRDSPPVGSGEQLESDGRSIPFFGAKLVPDGGRQAIAPFQHTGAYDGQRMHRSASGRRGRTSVTSHRPPSAHQGTVARRYSSSQ